MVLLFAGVDFVYDRLKLRAREIFEIFFRLRCIRGIRICHRNSSRRQQHRPHVLISWWPGGDYKTVSELDFRRYLYYIVFRGLLTETDIYIFCAVARVEVCRTVVSSHQHHYRLAVWYTISFLNSKTPIISGNIKLWAILWLFSWFHFYDSHLCPSQSHQVHRERSPMASLSSAVGPRAPCIPNKMW